MKPTSPFSPSLRLWKPWKTATCAHLFFLSGFLPGGFILKKALKHDNKKAPAAYDLTPRGFSIVRFVLQHLLGERPIEELDEGPKAERTDQGAKAHKATQQPAQQGAERIGEDAAPEVRAGCVVPQTEGKVIVGRDAEVGGLVERSAQRRDQHRRP